MSTSNWQRLEALLERVLELPQDRQVSFINHACGDDPALRDELLSLLEHHEEASGFFGELIDDDRPAGLERLGGIPNPSEDPYNFIGQTIHQYQVTGKIGQGGMGIVYQAQDLRLDRPVALKFLPPFWHDDAHAKLRFIHEAKAASALDHPNICTIYGFGETPQGQLFIAMRYYPGGTLKARIRKGPLSPAQAVSFGIQIAQGLQRAHSRGILHRDVKPGNIIVTHDDEIKIVDFGLAKLSGELDITRTGTTLGTAGYMAPEQIRAERVDHRADQWSLGVVLYEMLTSSNPFKAPTQEAAMYKILHEPPPPITGAAEQLPQALLRTVRRMLSKQVDQRYPNLDAALVDLNYAADQLSGTVSLRPFVEDKPQPSIAVLPFVNMSSDPDNAYFCDGLAEELIAALAAIQGLRVAARTSSFSFRDQKEQIEEIGARLHVTSVLEGSVRKSGDRLRITAQLIDVASGYQLWSGRYDRRFDDVFAIQDEISLAIVESLKLELLGKEREALVKRPTHNLEAYRHYLKGRFHWNQRSETSLAKGIDHFNKALALDPSFAQASSGLADCHIMLGFYHYRPGRVVYPQGRAAAMRALAQDDQLSEARLSLAGTLCLHDHDFQQAEAVIQGVIKNDPDQAGAHYWYAGFVLTPLGRQEEAFEQLEEAHRLEPLSLVVGAIRAHRYWWSRDFISGIQEAQKVLELNPNFWFGHALIGLSYEQLGQYKQATDAFLRSLELSPEKGLPLGMLGHAYAKSGDHNKAEEVLGKMNMLAQKHYIAAYDRALPLIALGRLEEAQSLLDQAYEERSGWVIFLGTDARFDPLHDTTAFQSLLARIGIPITK